MSSAATDLEPMRVVLVDDTPDIRFLLRVALDLDGGFRVVGEAGDGRQALAVVADTQPDLVLLDLAMPGMDGMQALPLLRKTCPAATVLVLSGFEDAALGPGVLAAGADGYLRKGATPRDILARARELRARRGGLHPAPSIPAQQEPWSLGSELLENAAFGLLRLSRDSADELCVRAINAAAREALSIKDARPPLPLAGLVPSLDDRIRVELAEQPPGRAAAARSDLGTLGDLQVQLHREGSQLIVVLMPLGPSTEARRLRRAIASTAHEMRNPVTVLVGATQALAADRDRLPPEVQDRLFEAVRRQARLLERATADLLAGAQQHHSRLEVNLTRVALRPLLEACAQAHPEAGHVWVDCPEEASVLADPGRLEQMVGNLLSNSVKYGAPPFAVQVTLPDTRDGLVAIDVSDAGLGVSPEFAPSLFEEFTREAGRSVHGTGLGLYVVRALAMAQGGRVDYTRRDERTFFTISLPQADGPDRVQSSVTTDPRKSHA